MTIDREPTGTRLRLTIMLVRKLPPLLLVPLLLAACNLPRPEVERPVPVTTEPAVDQQQCGWNWATQALPELSAEVQAAMEAAGLEGIQARAEAYGENCFGSVTGEVLYFAAMETDFRLQVTVEDLQDREALGGLLEQILVILDGFPPGTIAGPNPGYVGVAFQSGQETLNLWFTVTDGEAARAQGLHGAALLEELENR